MEDKKYCIKCGEEVPIDSLYCQKCGTKVPKIKIPKIDNIDSNINKLKSNKIPIIILLVILVVGGSYIFPSLWYQTDKADDLISKVDTEMNLADSKISDFNEKIENINKKYSYLYADFFDESTDSASKTLPEAKLLGMNRYFSESKALDSTKQDMSNHYATAKGYLIEAKKLRLPSWYYEYIDLRINSCDKYIEAMNIHNEAGVNKGKYLNAKINLEASRMNFALGDFATYGLKFYEADEYDSILNILDSSIEWYTKSYEFLDDAYDSVQLNNIPSIKSQIEIRLDFSKNSKLAFEAYKRESYLTATSYLETATNKLKSVREVNFLNCISELESWKVENVDKKYDKETQLWKEGNVYDSDSVRLWNANLS